VNVSGAGSHVPRVESAIRIIKERVRGHIAVLPFRLSFSLLVWLVYYCVGRINLVPTSSLTVPIPPRELLTGRKVNFKKDLKLSFGDYVEVIEQQSTNKMNPRSRGCIALMPTGNVQGTWNFLALDTGKVISRDNWVRLPMPDMVINALNTRAQAESIKVMDDPTFSVEGRAVELELESASEFLLMIK